MNQQYKGKQEWQRRYAEAHYKWSCEKHPNVVKDEFYTLPKFPDVTTANGLTQFVVNFLDWCGSHANRINTTGRMIKQGKDIQTAGGGVIKAKQIMIKSATKKGTADIVCTINGRSVHLECKVGKDRMSEAQLKQQQAVQQAGGYYYVIRDVDTFLATYDKFMAAPKMTLL